MGRSLGVAADVLPIFFLAALTPVLLFQAFGMVDALSTQSGYAVDDLRMTARTDSVGGGYVYDYSKSGVRHSVNQKSYDLASSAGGMDWSGSSVENDDVTASKALGNLESASESYMNQNYVQGFRPSNCDVDISDYDVALSQTGDGLDASYSPSSDVEFTCSFSDGNATYRVGSGVQVDLDLKSNRYTGLVSETDYVLENVQSAWDSTDRSYTDTATACGTTSGLEDDAEDNAVSEAESQYRSDAEDSYSSSDLGSGFDVDSDSFGVESYTETSSSGPSSTGNSCDCTCQESNLCSGRGGPTSGGSVSACGAGSCNSNEIEICDAEYEASSTIRVDSAEASVSVKDEEHKVLTSSGYSSMVFEVSDYVQDFT